jgi:hypothetical protein
LERPYFVQLLLARIGDGLVAVVVVLLCFAVPFECRNAFRGRLEHVIFQCIKSELNGCSFAIEFLHEDEFTLQFVGQ